MGEKVSFILHVRVYFSVLSYEVSLTTGTLNENAVSDQNVIKNWSFISAFQSTVVFVQQRVVRRLRVTRKSSFAILWRAWCTAYVYSNNPQHNTHTCETSNTLFGSTPCEKQTVCWTQYKGLIMHSLWARGCAGPFQTHGFLLSAFLSLAPRTRKGVGEGPGFGCVLRRARWK